MIFFFHKNSGEKKLVLTNTDYHSLVRVRRKKIGESIEMRNLTDEKKYTYIIDKIEKRKVFLSLTSVEKIIHSSSSDEKNIHLFWGICDAKTIYATLPILNQLGVAKISFIECERSQGNIYLSSEKIKNILIASCEQCGRNDILPTEILSFSEVLIQYPNILICDFNGEKFSSSDSLSQIFIGPEGGFSLNEKKMFNKKNVRTFSSENVLRSETACIVIASSFLI